MLVGREVFSSLDEEYEKQVSEGSDVSLNREDLPLWLVLGGD